MFWTESEMLIVIWTIFISEWLNSAITYNCFSNVGVLPYMILLTNLFCFVYTSGTKTVTTLQANWIISSVRGRLSQYSPSVLFHFFCTKLRNIKLKFQYCKESNMPLHDTITYGKQLPALLTNKYSNRYIPPSPSAKIFKYFSNQATTQAVWSGTQ